MPEPVPSPAQRRLRRTAYLLAAVWIIGAAFVYYSRITFAIYQTHGDTVNQLLAPLYPGGRETDR